MGALNAFRFRVPATPRVRATHDPGEPTSTIGEVADPSVTSPAPPSVRRLLANERYFGLDAGAFRTGAERTIARVAAADKRARVDVHSIAHDFALDAEASWTLLRQLVAAGLLRPTTAGAYRPTARMREYASASVVAPLSRKRAKLLVAEACKVAERINSRWTASPFRIESIAVSGSYMSRRKHLPELALWLVVKPRETPRWLRGPNKSTALRQILAAIGSLSSFVVVRITPRRDAVPRPFSIVFHASENATLPTWGRLRQWSASLGRKLG
jgi:hypothetical protein